MSSSSSEDEVGRPKEPGPVPPDPADGEQVLLRASDVQRMIEAAVDRALLAMEKAKQKRSRRSPSPVSSDSDEDDVPSTSSGKYVLSEDVSELLGHVRHNLGFDSFPG